MRDSAAVVEKIREKVRAGGVVRYDPLRSRILVLTPELSARYTFSDTLAKILASTPGCMGIFPNVEQVIQEALK